MKKGLSIGLLLAGFIAYGQENESAKTAQYRFIQEKGTTAQKDSLANVLFQEASDYKKEQEFLKTANLLYALGHTDKQEQLEQIARKKFPRGSLTRTDFAEDVFYQAETASEKEKAFKTLVKKWPVEKFKGEELSYDYALASLASDFADEGQSQKAKHYLEMMHERFWRGNGYLPVGQKLLAIGDTVNAAPILKTAVDDSYYFLTIPEEKKDNKARFAAMGYASSVSVYVSILVNQRRYDEAMVYIENALDAAPEQADVLATVYYKSLLGTGRKLEAYNLLTKLYVQGWFNIEPDLSKLYTELNGSANGFERFRENLKRDFIQQVRNHIKGMETYKPAPDFELLNMKGEKVSLASLRGKVVVLDFWATWCQPCKNSFPGMKATQLKYENDEDVAFLFINTWERDTAYKKNVAAFINQNNYPFEVLFDDQRDAQTGQLLAEKLGVTGIPAKFIIDKDGNIRYFMTGSKSEVDYIKAEMTELIESAKQPYKG